MIRSGHLITGGSLATAVFDGWGVQDRRQFHLYGLCLSPTLFLLALFLLVLFLLTLTLRSKRMRKNARKKS